MGTLVTGKLPSVVKEAGKAGSEGKPVTVGNVESVGNAVFVGKTSGKPVLTKLVLAGVLRSRKAWKWAKIPVK